MSIQPLIKNDRLAHTALFPNKEAFSIQTKDINLRSNDGAIDLIMDYDTNGYHHLASIMLMLRTCQPNIHPSHSHKNSELLSTSYQLKHQHQCSQKNNMIFRYPVIIALTVAMAAVPAAQGRLGGSNIINDDTHHKPITAQVELQMDTAEQELHEVDAVSNFEAGVQLEELDALAEQEETPDEAESNIFDLEAIVRQKAKIIVNLREARAHHRMEIERMQLMLSELEGSQHPKVERMNKMLNELRNLPMHQHSNAAAAVITTAVISV